MAGGAGHELLGQRAMSSRGQSSELQAAMDETSGSKLLTHAFVHSGPLVLYTVHRAE